MAVNERKPRYPQGCFACQRANERRTSKIALPSQTARAGPAQYVDRMSGCLISLRKLRFPNDAILATPRLPLSLAAYAAFAPHGVISSTHRENCHGTRQETCLAPASSGRCQTALIFLLVLHESDALLGSPAEGQKRKLRPSRAIVSERGETVK